MVRRNAQHQEEAEQETIDEKFASSPMGHFCTQCGSKLQTEDRFCFQCGVAISPITKQYAKCGKQHSKSFNKIGIAILSAILVLGIVIVGVVLGTTDDDNANTSRNDAPVASNKPTISFEKWSEAHFIAEILEGENSDYFEYMVYAYKIPQNGYATYAQAKDAVIDYINDLPIDYGERIILFRWIYQSDNTYCSDIVDYLNNRDDVSADDMIFILEMLGFWIGSDNTVHWD